MAAVKAIYDAGASAAAAAAVVASAGRLSSPPAFLPLLDLPPARVAPAAAPAVAAAAAVTAAVAPPPTLLQTPTPTTHRAFARLSSNHSITEHLRCQARITSCLLLAHCCIDTAQQPLRAHSLEKCS